MAERDLDASGSFEAAERVFYQTDGLGSATELSDATGAVARTRVYDAYGRIVQEAGGGIAQPYAFTGRELDAESALYFYRARYYDPATGRFLSEDPLGFAAGDANLYSYAFDSPVNLRDPGGRFGLAGCLVGGVIGAASRVGGTFTGQALTALVDAIDAELRYGSTGFDLTRSESGNDCGEPVPFEPLPLIGDHDTLNLTNEALEKLLAQAGMGFLSGCIFGASAPVTVSIAAAGAVLQATTGAAIGFTSRNVIF